MDFVFLQYDGGFIPLHGFTTCSLVASSNSRCKSVMSEPVEVVVFTVVPTTALLGASVMSARNKGNVATLVRVSSMTSPDRGSTFSEPS